MSAKKMCIFKTVEQQMQFAGQSKFTIKCSSPNNPELKDIKNCCARLCPHYISR